MAASEANRYDIGKSPVAWLHLAVSNVHIYDGTLVAVDTNGYLVQLADTASLVLVGMARQEVDNSGGSAGDLFCDVEPLEQLQYLTLDATSPLQAWIGKLCYAIDDHTVGIAGGSFSNNILVGKIVKIVKTGTSGKVLVALMNRTAG